MLLSNSNRCDLILTFSKLYIISQHAPSRRRYMADSDALECMLVIGDLESEFVSNSHIMMKIPVDLYRAVNHLADQLNLLAETLRPPGERGRIRHVTLPHQVVYLLAVVRQNVFRVNQTGQLLVSLHQSC